LTVGDDRLVGPPTSQQAANALDVDGASTFARPADLNANLNPGNYAWRLSAGTKLPDGLLLVPDGEIYGGTIQPSSHNTIMPAFRMTYEQFLARFSQISWGQRIGKLPLPIDPQP
jgi:hypothetical protein